MDIKDLKQLYLAELQEARSFEDQIANRLGDLAGKATDQKLKSFLEADEPEARSHRDRVERLLSAHGVEPKEHDDASMHSLLSEARKWADQIDEPAVRDAALIASAQRIQHYEIAIYGALAAWSRQLGLDDTDTLTTILEEEKGADAKLTELAESSVNLKAA